MLAVPDAAAQASTYLPLDDWATPWVEHLIRARVLDDPDPLSRPLTHGSILRAIATADTTDLPEGIRASLRSLRLRLESGGPDPRYRLDLFLEGAAASQDGRDPLRGEGNAWAGARGGLDMHATMGPLVFSVLPYLDTHLPSDPDWPGDTSRVDLPGRFTNAYIGLQTRYLQITYGSVARNWGMPELDGLGVSGFAYSYDHLALRIGSDRLRIESILTELDPTVSGLGEPINRLFIAHRVTFRPVRALTFAIGSNVLSRGVGAGWDTHYLNPFKLPRVTAVDESVPDSANSAYVGDLRVEVSGNIVLTAQLLMDDWDVSPANRSLPDRFGGTLGVEFPMGPTIATHAFLTGVSSLAYRTQQGPDFGFLRNGVGLGRNHSDYLQATATASILPRANMLVAPEVTMLRQGESDFSSPFPATPAPDYPFVFVGVVETTWRLAVSGRWTLPPSLDLTAHAGMHLVRNDGHVVGVSAVTGVWGLTARWRFFSGDWR